MIRQYRFIPSVKETILWKKKILIAFRPNKKVVLCEQNKFFTEAGWSQVKKIFYLGAATYNVAAAT